MNHALIEFLILPEENDTQERVSYKLETNIPLKEYISLNHLNFETLQYRLDSHHHEFELKMTAKIAKQRVNPFDFQQLIHGDERSILNSMDFEVDSFPFLQTTPLTALPNDFSYPVISEKEQVFEFAVRVNKYVYNELTYCDLDANTQKTIKQTLADKKGVCQDYTHLMLAILRKNKIPARYVSGYLNPGNNHLGAGAIHAWVQASIPGIGWVGFDPTNKLLEDYHYIKIAHGVDINDCHNVKGVVIGPGTNNTNYSVLVKEQNKIENQ